MHSSYFTHEPEIISCLNSRLHHPLFTGSPRKLGSWSITASGDQVKVCNQLVMVFNHEEELPGISDTKYDSGLAQQ